MRGVKKTGVKLFRLSFSTDRSSRKSRFFLLDPPGGKLSRKKLSRKSRVFRLDPLVGKLSRKKLSRKSAFSTVEESPIWASVEVENGRFRLTNPTV